MNDFITLFKILWLCLTVYMLVKDSIIAHLAIKAFLDTGALEEKVKKIPSTISLRVVNVVLALAIVYYL